MSDARDIRWKLVFINRVEDRLRAVDPDFVVVVANDAEAAIVFESLAGPVWLVENVAHAQHEPSREVAFAQGSKRVVQLTINTCGPLVDDHQVGGEAQHGLFDDRTSSAFDSFRAVEQKT